MNFSGRKIVPSFRDKKYLRCAALKLGEGALKSIVLCVHSGTGERDHVSGTLRLRTVCTGYDAIGSRTIYSASAAAAARARASARLCEDRP